MNQETRVGLFVLGAVFVIGFGSFWLGDIKFERRYRVHVLFNTVEGLPVKGPVKTSGVEIGRVEKIDLSGGRARVTAEIDEKYQLHKDAVAKIGSTGFIGSKFLNMTPGSADAPLLQDGDTIEGKPTLSFDDLADKLTELFKKDDKYGDPMENFRATLANLKEATGVMGETLKNNKQTLDSILKNTQKFVANIEEITSKSKADIEAAMTNFRQITERAEAMLKNIQEGKGAVGKLVSDPETADNVKQTVASFRETAKDAETLFGRIRRISVDWDLRERYDFADKMYKSDFGLKIIPKPGKFYMISINNLGTIRDRSQPGADLERRDTITGVMGKEFGPLTVYAGVIRSRAGVGGAFRPFWTNPAWERRFEIQAEAYDFGREETLQGIHFNKPVYNLGAQLGIFRWLYAGIGVEDMAVRDHVYGNLNVRLRDDDISYLFGLVSLGKP